MALKHDGLASGRAGPDPARNLQHYVEPKSRGRRNRGAWLQLVVYGRRNRGAPPLEFTSAHEKPSSSIAILLGHSSFQEFCRSQRKESFGSSAGSSSCSVMTPTAASPSGRAFHAARRLLRCCHDGSKIFLRCCSVPDLYGRACCVRSFRTQSSRRRHPKPR
jgi:hypothetical protein